MLRFIEFGLLAVTLLVIVGLVVSGSPGKSNSENQPAPSGDGSETQEHGKAL